MQTVGWKIPAEKDDSFRHLYAAWSVKQIERLLRWSLDASLTFLCASSGTMHGKESYSSAPFFWAHSPVSTSLLL